MDRLKYHVDPSLSLQSPVNSDEYLHTGFGNESPADLHPFQLLSSSHQTNECDGAPNSCLDSHGCEDDVWGQLSSVTAVPLCPEYPVTPVMFGSSVTAGRLKENSFRLSEGKVSQQHFTIRYNFLAFPSDGPLPTTAGCFLEDHSRNGTWLRRGDRRWLLRGTRASLNDGDVISLVRPYCCPSHGESCLGNNPDDPEGCMLRFGDRPACGTMAIRFEIRSPVERRTPRTAAEPDVSGGSARDAGNRASPASALPPPTPARKAAAAAAAMMGAREEELEGAAMASRDGAPDVARPAPRVRTRALQTAGIAGDEPQRAAARTAAAASIGDLREWEGLCRTAERVAAAASTPAACGAAASSGGGGGGQQRAPLVPCDGNIGWIVSPAGNGGGGCGVRG
jgi:hypothetical protein